MRCVRQGRPSGMYLVGPTCVYLLGCVWCSLPGRAAWARALAPLVLVGMQVKLRMAPRRLTTRATMTGH